MPTATEICSKAAELTGGDRAKSHGDKVENHLKIARMWNAYLWNVDPTFSGLSALDVANMMEALKIARRQAGSHNVDDYVDGAGYAGVAGEIAERSQAVARAAAEATPGIGHNSLGAQVINNCAHPITAVMRDGTCGECGALVTKTSGTA